MRLKRKVRLWLRTSVAGFGLAAAAFLLMPAMPDKAEGGFMRVLPGLLFWLGILVGAGGFAALNGERRRWNARHPDRAKADRRRLPGVISFFRSFPGAVSDVTLAVCILALILSAALKRADGYGMYILLALTFFSFCTHCIYNGKNQLFVQEMEKNRRPGRAERQQDGRVEKNA